MLTKPLPDKDHAKVPARSGHGAASVIARLHEEMAQPLVPADEEADAGALDESKPAAGAHGGAAVPAKHGS